MSKIEKAAAAEMAKVAAKFEAAKKIRQILDEAAKLCGEDAESEILDLVCGD